MRDLTDSDMDVSHSDYCSDVPLLLREDGVTYGLQLQPLRMSQVLSVSITNYIFNQVPVSFAGIPSNKVIITNGF